MPEIISTEDTQYAVEIVQQICAQVGPCLAGSSQERERAALIKKELDSHLGPGNVFVEEFKVAPGAHLGALRLNAHLTPNLILRNRKRSEGSSSRAAGIPRFARNDIRICHPEPCPERSEGEVRDP